MTEVSIDRIIPEQAFALALSKEAKSFFRLANTVRGNQADGSRRLLAHQLGIEADEVESFLDDHGAKTNEAFCFFRELVASVRGFASVGFVLGHLQHRLRSYQTELVDGGPEALACRAAIARARTFVSDSTVTLLGACLEEALSKDVDWDEGDVLSQADFLGPVNLRLPHNIGEGVLEEDNCKVAEVASKFLQVCEMFSHANILPIEDPVERNDFLRQACSEERARVYEATVHNLQSTYDTYIKGTSLEAGDLRLVHLRGHASAAFHLLEAVTSLTHFVERHESGARKMPSGDRMGRLLNREKVQEVILNDLLFWARELILSGEEIARELLNSFSQMQELELQVPEGVSVHARPASLIVAIVNHYEMPVELCIEGKVCNAASILDVLICAGSNPEATSYLFRGDARPLADLERLFVARLGETGLDQLPAELNYLLG